MAAGKADVLSVTGSAKGTVELPKAFSANVDEGLIKRAVLASQSARIQPKAPLHNAGRLNTAEYIGRRSKPQRHRTINVGHARLPRMKNRRYILSGDVASVPQAVGGPKAHPPKLEKVYAEKINKKEKRKAVAAATAATADAKRVAERGHRFGEGIKFPVVIEAAFEESTKTKEVENVLKAVKLWEDVERAKKGKSIRAGKGKRRGRKYKRVKSLLIVAENPEKVCKAARNIEGVDVIAVKNLNAEVLAPGAVPGRLTLWSEAAIKAM